MKTDDAIYYVTYYAIYCAAYYVPYDDISSFGAYLTIHTAAMAAGAAGAAMVANLAAGANLAASIATEVLDSDVI